MQKIDLKKRMINLYGTSCKDPVMVEVPKLNYIMIDGKGDPNSSEEFSNAMEALFKVSYTLKFMHKKAFFGEGIEYGVMPAQGLWWSNNMEDFTSGTKDNWEWTLMILQPDFVTEERYNTGLKEVKARHDLAALNKLRYESFAEGKAAQILHKGPFSEEGPTIERLHKFIKNKGLEIHGKHHEIYLSDTRRAKPENWKTIIRQPVK